MKLSAQHESNGVTIIVALPSTGEYLHVRFEKNETKKYATLMFGDRPLEGEFSIRPVKIPNDDEQDLELVFTITQAKKQLAQPKKVIEEPEIKIEEQPVERKIKFIDEYEILPPPVTPPEEPDPIILEEKVSVNTELVRTEQERILDEEEIKPKPVTRRRR